MLSHEENELLVRTGPSTPMGALFRLYWIPFLLSKDLVADGQPKRVMLLSEDLVVFRDTQNRVGLIANACAHRGAPMMFGRNEDCGLRCVYHGWKYDITGAITDVPAEPPRSRIKDKVRITAYPCRERNGVIWTYMGPQTGTLPPLPNMEWNLVPEENVQLSMRVQECNWLQTLEGDIDSVHAPILHGRLDANKGSVNAFLAKRDLRPTFECVRQDFGVSIAARRKIDENNLYWRVNQFVLPFYTLVPPQSKFPDLSGRALVPVDDNHCLSFMYTYLPAAPLPARTRRLFDEGHEGRETGHTSRHAFVKKNPTVPFADYWTKFNPENGFQFDYQSQVDTWFSGFPGFWVQDTACTAGLGPICDRTKEHLSPSDAGIAMTRRALLEAAIAYRDRGIKPPGVDDPDVFMVRAASLTLPEGASWIDGGREHMRARLGVDFGYQP